MAYVVATGLQQALELLADRPVAVIAGGTDWFPAQGDRPFRGDMLDLTRIEGLRGITAGAEGWRIGATTTWTDVIRADLPPAFDGLKAAARQVGSVQIQNAGTVAGNLCNASPAADGVPPLLTLDAEVELTSLAGCRRLPLADFLTGVRRTDRRPDELLTALHLPFPPEQARSAFVKLGARKYLVISICMVAVLVAVEEGHVAEARIAVGAASPVAQRLGALEQELRGQPVQGLAGRVTPAHLAELSPISDIRASASYRQEAALVALRRALALAVGQGAQTDGGTE